jgi:ribonucleoside-diphosphate reductase alpha chain
MYYLRTKAATDAIKFTVVKENPHVMDVTTAENVAFDRENEKVTVTASVSATTTTKTIDKAELEKMHNSTEMDYEAAAIIACSLDNPEGCEMCGS